MESKEGGFKRKRAKTEVTTNNPRVDVSLASGANVDGYVNSVTVGLQRPASHEGGRGTRRTRMAVTAAAEMTMEQDGVTVEVDDEEEWIKVDFEPKAEQTPAAAVKPDGAEGSAPVPNAGGVKAEGTAGLHGRDALIARARAERHLKYSHDLTWLLAHAARGHFLVRVANRLRCMLPKLAGREKFAKFVADAAPLVATLKDTALQRAAEGKDAPTNLRPCWVSHAKDGSGTPTGPLVQLLIATAMEWFPLQQQQPAADGNAVDAAPQAACGWPKLVGVKGAWMDTLPASVLASVAVAALGCALGLRMRIVISVETAPDILSLVAPGPPRETGEPAPEVDPTKAAEKPKAWAWNEVWCPARRIWVSVNPMPKSNVRWGALYAFAFGTDHACDVTPRYVAKWSDVCKRRIESVTVSQGYFASSKRSYHAVNGLVHLDDSDIGPKRIPVLDPDSVTAQLVRAQLHCTDRHRKKQTSGVKRSLAESETDSTEVLHTILAQERAQMELLVYSEPVPTTLTGVKRHALYCLEQDLQRFEAIHPRDSTTLVGYIKNKPVYRREAAVPLRGRDGWLRAKRMVASDAEPYKTITPSESRSGGMKPVELIRLYGHWQTVPFAPAPLPSSTDADTTPTIPLIHNAQHYVLLDETPPPGLVHIDYKGVANVIRKTSIQFASVVVGYEKRVSLHKAQASWFPLISGIIVLEKDAKEVERAYWEWVDVTLQKEAERRRARVMRWWRVLIQRTLVRLRLGTQFLE